MNDDRISEVYKGEIMAETTQARARNRIHWMCSQARGMRVLDIGCSQGIASILLAREGFHVTGIDIQDSRIEYALSDLAKEPASVSELVEFRVGSGSNLEFDDGSFDVVLLGEVLEHLTVPGKVLEEVARVLKDDGVVAMTTPFGSHPHHDHKQTFYPGELQQLVGLYLDVHSMDVVDGYFRMAASPARNRVGGVGPAPVVPVALDHVWRRLDLEVKNGRVELRELGAQLANLQKTNAASVLRNKELVAARDAAAVARSALAAELKSAEGERAALREKVVAVGKRLAYSEAQARRVVSLIRRVDQLEIDRWKLRSRLAEANWKVRSLRASKSWRMGAALSSLRSNPLRILLLPIRIAKTAFGTDQLPPRPEPLPEPQKRLALSATRAESQKSSTLDVTDDQAVADVAAELSAARTLNLFLPEQVLADIRPARNLRVATVLDTFSSDVFEHEFMAVPITPENWRQVVDEGAVSLLFVESAWRGVDGSWNKKIANREGPAPEFHAMVEGFRSAGIPTVFWNKEDPPNYEHFIEAARLFDWVFTTCEEVIPDYHRDLGHDRVRLLPFSVQPRIHNPIAIGRRRPSVAFAGTYYANKHPDRAVQVEQVLDPAREFDLVIFSRVESSGSYQWPERFDQHIVGTLSYEDVLSAYKLFQVFINVNSVIDSASMCARRIFELAASGTPILSGVSPAIDRFFEGIVAQAGGPDETRQHLEALLGSEDFRARISLKGVREVMRLHTASKRVDHIMDVIGLEGQRSAADPMVSIVAATQSLRQFERALEIVDSQNYSNLQLVAAVSAGTEDREGIDRLVGQSDMDVVVVEMNGPVEDLSSARVEGGAAASGDYLAFLDPDHYYGAEFVGDLVAAFGYTDAGIVGKWTHFARHFGDERPTLRFGGSDNAYVDMVAPGTAVFARAVFDKTVGAGVPLAFDVACFGQIRELGVRIYSADRFNYLMTGEIAPAGGDGDALARQALDEVTV